MQFTSLPHPVRGGSTSGKVAQFVVLAGLVKAVSRHGPCILFRIQVRDRSLEKTVDTRRSRCTFESGHRLIQPFKREPAMMDRQFSDRARLFMVVACSLVLSLGTTAAKASGPGDAKTASEKAKAIAAELAKFQGTWQLISAETNGKKLPEDQAKQIRVNIDGDHHTVTFGDKVMARQVKFVFDPTARPKITEDTLEEGPNKGKKIRGIYVLDGDILTSCVGAIDGPRPTEFSAKPDSGQSLRRFQRVRPTAGLNAELEAANAKEYRAFEGTWRIVSIAADGKQIPAAKLRTRD